MRTLLALDQGTTSSRAIIFAGDGSIRAVAQKEFTQIFPQAGWVEHDPREIWASQIGVAIEALGRAGKGRRALGEQRTKHVQPTRARGLAIQRDDVTRAVNSRDARHQFEIPIRDEMQRLALARVQEKRGQQQRFQLRVVIQHEDERILRGRDAFDSFHGNEAASERK